MLRSCFIRLFLWSALFNTPLAAMALTCEGTDWIAAVCNFQPLEGVRCWTDPIAAGNFVAQCKPGTDGCDKTAEGACSGWVPTGHWIVTGTVKDGIRRCRCGCFGEETKFTSKSGRVSAKDLIGKADGSVELLANNLFDSWGVGFQRIKSIVAGQEPEPVYVFKTEAGREIVLSAAHPVLVVDRETRLETMKRAEDVKADELLVDEDGKTDRLLTITKQDYTGKVVNFDIETNSPQQHIVIANGLRMGDNIWQQNLAQRSTRLAKREDIFKVLRSLEKKP